MLACYASAACVVISNSTADRLGLQDDSACGLRLRISVVVFMVVAVAESIGITVGGYAARRGWAAAECVRVAAR